MTSALLRLRAWIATSPAALVGIAVLFVGLRLLALTGQVAPSSDADWYFTRAVLLAQGHGYQDQGHLTAFWPPGWPLALAAVMRVCGTGLASVAAINLVAACASGWLLHDLGQRMGGALAGRIAVLLYAVYPNGLFYVPLALTEVVFTALLLLGWWLALARGGWRRPGLGALLAGAVFGYATLIKAQMLVLAPLAMLITPARRRGRDALLATGLALIVVSPWTMRNAVVLGHFVPVSTNGGITLLTGNNDSARGGYTTDDPLVRAIDARKAALGEWGYDRAATMAARDWIASHPGRFVGLIPLKLWHLWGPDGEGAWGWEAGSPFWAAAPHAFAALRALNQVWYMGLMLALAVGPWRLGRRTPVMPYALALFLSVIALVFSGQSRFHFPEMPMAALVAGLVIAQPRRNGDAPLEGYQ